MEMAGLQAMLVALLQLCQLLWKHGMHQLHQHGCDVHQINRQQHCAMPLLPGSSWV
jgi:CRISPR/Cas system CSM-associated protein Csm3 (group 7 of RAMP superfamily)